MENPPYVFPHKTNGILICSFVLGVQNQWPVMAPKSRPTALIKVCRVAAFWGDFFSWLGDSTGTTEATMCVLLRFSFVVFLRWTWTNTQKSRTHLVLRTSSDGNHHQKKERIWRIHILDETNQRGESHCLNLRLVSGSLVAGKQPIVYEHKPQDFEHNWPQPPSLWWWVDPPLIIQTQQQSHSQNLHRLTCQVHCFGFFLVDGWHDVDGPNLKIHVKTVCSQLFSRSVFQFYSHLQDQFHPPFAGCVTQKKTPQPRYPGVNSKTPMGHTNHWPQVLTGAMVLPSTNIWETAVKGVGFSPLQGGGLYFLGLCHDSMEIAPTNTP